ncbi:MAG: CotH kinase family protein [Saprospiraceae bacterium]|nr:CotH kinase family protein [Saprospiraceae bacterium]
MILCFKKWPSTILLSLIVLHTQAQTFSSTVNQPIPDDGSTVTYDILVSGLPAVIDSAFGLERVCLNMTHTYTEDMTVKLQSPNGKIVMLFGGVGGGGDNFFNTCLAGEGPSIAGSSAPFSGTFQCMGVLGNFNKGQDPNGVWTLILHDTYPFADEGFLIDWSITFSDEPAQPFIFTSSNLPIVKLTTVNDPIGDEPKVPVYMQIIDNGPGVRNELAQSTYAYEGLIMTEWQGFTGPYYPKKNYDFNIVDASGNQIDTSILGMPKESDWIFKAEYLDKTLLKNSVTYEMARRMGRYAPRTQPCEIVLDDEYIGLYVLTETVKRDNKRVDIARMTESDTSGAELTGGYIFEMNINNNDPGDWYSQYLPINYATSEKPVEYKYVYPKRENILPQQSAYLQAYVDSFENALKAPDFADPVNGYRKHLDVPSFIDFLIVNEYSVNYDSYGRSTYLVKEKITDGGKIKCGPPWDYDRAMDYYNPNSTNGWVWEITHPYWPFPFWWSRLWEDENYRKELACRWLMLRQNPLKTSEFMQLIDSMATYVDEGQQRNFRVWNDLGGMSYANHIDSLKSFVARRLSWIDATLAAENVHIPSIYLPADTLLCSGDIFDASVFIGPQYDYNWQPGPDTAVINFTENGLYHLLVTDQYGCFTRAPMNVTLASPLNAQFNGQPISGSTWSFNPVTTDAASYLWDFGDGQNSAETAPQHTYDAPGTYLVSLTVDDLEGCDAQTSQNTIQVIVSETSNLLQLEGRIFPNPFEDKIEIAFDQPTDAECIVRLENELGQTLVTRHIPAGTNQASITTTQLPSGAYLLKIKHLQRVWAVKLIKL